MKAKCSECGGDRLNDSAVPGLVTCRLCGKVSPAPKGWGVEVMPDKVAPDAPEVEPLQVESHTVKAPDEIECVWGWRAWTLKASGPVLLHSVTHSSCFWTPREPTVATCPYKGRRKSHEVPGDDCSCGLYAAKTLEHLLDHMGYAGYDIETGSIRVVGKVKMWGKVIEGTQGWRAEFGYPERFYVPFEGWRHMERLSNAYGAECELLNTLRGELD